MKTTGNLVTPERTGKDYALCPHTARGERGSRVSTGTGIRPAVAAIGAAALLAVLGTLPPAAHAATCSALQRGTLSGGNTFTPSSTGSDYYTVCTGDADGQGVSAHDLLSSASLSGAATVDTNDGNARFVVDLSNAFLDSYLDEFPVDDGSGNRIFRGGLVVLGTEGGAGDWNEGINLSVGEIDRYGDLNIDSHAAISTTGGARGIQVHVDGNTPSQGRLKLRNFGFVETTGGGASHGGRRGYGITVSSRDGVAEVVNESGASVTARGPGGRGIIAGTDGSAAIATNRGTVTTYGGPEGDRRAYGVAAFANWYGTNDGSGSARATNDVGGTVTTHGDGARGVSAYSGWNGIQGGTAVATNRGTVTTRGNTDSRRTAADGVYANSNGGTARATNEAGATIRTYGTGARGVGADNSHGSVSGRAEVENRGTISTSGQYANTGAHGMSAWSEHNSATAVNHAGATVTTSGRGASGVQASAGGGPDETALASNRGTVITTGDTFHDASRVSATVGVVAYGVGGEASAVAENAYEGVVDVGGTGARGVWAVAWSGYGDATARNHGRITTRGDVHRVDRTGTENDTSRSPNALQSTSRYSDAIVVNEVGGVIETHGTVGYGLDAYADGGGSAIAVNRGRVTTRGESADDLPGNRGRTIGARGISVYSRHGSARAGNDSTGRVDTHGKRAFGVFAESGADGSRTSGRVEVVNRGQVHTRGWNADGVVAIALHPGTADNPNHVRATNTAGASVTTEGSGASGLAAGIFVPACPPYCPTVAPATSTVIARNDGTVVTGVVEATGATGDDMSMDAGTYASNGVAASFFSSAGTTISSAGDVTVINTGDVTVKRVNATGLYAETFGSGTATVRMTGGSVSAEGADGRGLWARTGTTGTVDATIAGGAEIAAASSAGIAAQFQGGTTNVRLLDSVLDGRVVFGTGTDTFTVRDSRVTGAIDFGAGSDTLSAHGDTWLDGAVSNLDTLTKRGSGNLVMGGNATFSSGASAEVESGGLVFTGQFNLGTTGTMRIHDAARLTAVLVDTAAPPQITAGGGITFDGDEELFVQVSSDITATSESTYLTRLTTTTGNPIANGTTVTGRTGQVALRTARGPSTVVDIGHIPLVGGATSAAGTVVTSGVRLGKFTLDAPADLTEVPAPLATLDDAGTGAVGSGGPGLSLGGGVSALGSALLDVFDDGMASFAQDGTRHREVLPAAGSFGMRTRDGGLDYWARSWAGDTPVLAGGAQTTVRGAEMGVDSPLGSGLRLGASIAPEVSVSSVPAGAGTRLEGVRYAVRGGWRGERFHVGASVSKGRYRAHSMMDNPVAGGGLSSAFGLVQDHVQAGAGARMTWGAVQVVPSASVLSGALRHDAHTAEGAAFRAEVPAFSQRYHGWKSEVEVSPARWLRGPKSLRWRPALHLYTQRTRSAAPASLEVAQHDRAGVLSLSSAARASGLPDTVHGFNATVDAVHSKAWRMQLGLAGMESDGDYDQAVYARLHIRF